jgi:glycosyltransferase involved in cell wall biosynthesis
MISIVMPAHNEERYLEPAIKTVVQGLRERGYDFEVIIAENGSTDRTGSRLSALAASHKEVAPIRLPAADYGAALRTGFDACSGEFVINFDVDFVDLAFLDEALMRLQDPSVAVVVGSKRAPGALDGRGIGRRVITSVFSTILRAGFGLRVTDTHGIKAMRRAAVQPIVGLCKFGEDVFDTELILRAERAGLVVVEIPVSVEELRPARTPIWSRIPRSLIRLGQLRVTLWLEGGGPDRERPQVIG